MIYLYCFLVFNVGALFGMGLIAWFLGANGFKLKAKDGE